MWKDTPRSPDYFATLRREKPGTPTAIWISCGELGDPVTGLPIGNTISNLEAAIAGETSECVSLYPEMARTAREEGFSEIADWFETLPKAEANHAARFQPGLKSIR